MEKREGSSLGKSSNSPASSPRKAHAVTPNAADDHYAIVTYWESFEEHEKSHADKVFRKTFAALTNMCSDTKELGYDMLGQGEAKTP